MNIYIGTFDLESDAALASDKARQYNKSGSILLNFATIADYNEARSTELGIKGLTSRAVNMSVKDIEAIAKKRMEEYAAKISAEKSKKKIQGNATVVVEGGGEPSFLDDSIDHPNPNNIIGKGLVLCRVVTHGTVCASSANKKIPGAGRNNKAIKVCALHFSSKVKLLAKELYTKRKAEAATVDNPQPKKRNNSRGRKKKANAAQVSTTTTERTTTKPQRACSKVEPFVSFQDLNRKGQPSDKRADQVELVTPPRPADWTAASTNLEPIPNDTIINLPQGDDLEFRQILDEIQGNENIPELVIQALSQFTVCQKKSNHGLSHNNHTGMREDSYGIMCHCCQNFKDSGIFLPSSLVLNSNNFVTVKNINKVLKHLSNCPHFSNEEYQKLLDIKDRTC